MDRAIREKILRQILWDYNIPYEDIEAVLSGEREKAGHFSREKIFIRIIESYPWFTIIKLFTPLEIQTLLTREVIKSLRSPFPFYLTGGTALGRFYLNHRYSDDLGYFVNADNRYPDYISELKSKIEQKFRVNTEQSLYSEDFSRIFIAGEGVALKIEFVNDVAYYPGKPATFRFGLVDTPLNILSNKLTAIVSRDEPKDIFDIVYLSRNYSFNWEQIFYHSKAKAAINEIDVEQRLSTFPSEALQYVNWLYSPPEIKLFSESLRQIANDFLLGGDNTLGSEKIAIEKAVPE
jgi:hypothetical protein